MNHHTVITATAAKPVLAAAIVVAVVSGCAGATPTPSPTASRAATPSLAATPVTTPFVVTRPSGGVPGITVTIQAPGWRSLPEVEAIEKGTDVANLPEAAILFWASLAGTEFYVPEDPCQAESTRPDEPATSVDEIVAALAAQASRNASEPEDVTVGGYAGKSITLHVPDDAEFDECELGEFVSYGTNEDPLGRFHQGPGQIDELWVLDVDGAVVIIDAMYRPDTSVELVEEMRSIAESATFDTP